MNNVLISVYDKSNIVHLINSLSNLNIYSTGGTYKYLDDHDLNLNKISDYTEFPEMMNGRVKTLHPKIFGGLLYDDKYEKDVKNNNIVKFNIVVINLYPFDKVYVDGTHDECIENIDIGGVSLIRAAAKNYKNVAILTSPNQYKEFIKFFPDKITLEYRKNLARDAFNTTYKYDQLIYNWFSGFNFYQNEYRLISNLKYGCNPHQKANIYTKYNLPFKKLNGDPGYINILDAINSWNLVCEVRYSLSCICAASYKHISPAGVAIGDNSKQAYMFARNCDPKSSFGDFIAINTKINKECAEYIKNCVSDGIIALGYDEDALEILNKKKDGKFIILKGYPVNFTQNHFEFREKNGVVFSQEKNNYTFSDNDLTNIVTENKEISDNIKTDLILANITVKYTQSNSICFAHNNKVIGIGAGQQSRIDCVKLAKQKVITYFLRQHPTVTNLKFKKELKNQDRINAKIQYIEENMSDEEYKLFMTKFTSFDKFLPDSEKQSFIKTFDNVVMSSDAFFPFRDSIDQASMINTKYIIQPGGSIADDSVVEACNQYNICMVNTGIRLFEH